MKKIHKGHVAFGLLFVINFLSFQGPLDWEYFLKEKLAKVVIGYYPSWKRGEFDCQKIEYKHLTHIAHAFTKPDSEGNLIVDGNYLYPELNKRAHEKKVKVLMSIGGWGNCEGFPGMASTEEKRNRFITQVLEFCRANSYDGVDIDWEFVSNPSDQQNFVFFIKELSAALKAKSPPLLLTMASPVENYWGKWVNFEELINDFDYISFMTYSYHGNWSDRSGHNSPLYSCSDLSGVSVNDSFLYACLRQIPKEKLLLGIPFFGKSFDSGDLHQEFEKSNYFGYSEVRDFLDSGWRYIWDNCAKVPFLQKPDQTEIISFDDERSISEKCQFIKEKNVAGVIVWEISQDYSEDSSPLLKVVGREFSFKKMIKEKRSVLF